MDYMFSGCSSLNSLDISNFNTNNVDNMSYMFLGIYNNCIIISKDSNILSLVYRLKK